MSSSILNNLNKSRHHKAEIGLDRVVKVKEGKRERKDPTEVIMPILTWARVVVTNSSSNNSISSNSQGQVVKASSNSKMLNNSNRDTNQRPEAQEAMLEVRVARDIVLEMTSNNKKGNEPPLLIAIKILTSIYYNSFNPQFFFT